MGDLALALRMSLGESSNGSPVDDEQPNQKKTNDRDRATSPAGFRYGEDYPKPIIQPVSLRNTEDAESEARRQQATRDQQIAAAKRPRTASRPQRGAGYSFNKNQWEHHRQQWSAETPTSAGWRPGRSNSSNWNGSKGNGSFSSQHDGKHWNADQGCETAGASAIGTPIKAPGKRNRWNAKTVSSDVPEDTRCGG